MNREINNQSEKLIGLLKSKNERQENESQERNRLFTELAAENKKKVINTGIVNIIQAIVDSNTIDGKLFVIWSPDCSSISVVDKSNREEKVIIKSWINKNDELGLIWRNGNKPENQFHLPFNGDIANEIFDYINCSSQYQHSKRCELEIHKREVEEKAKKEKKENETKIFNYSFAYKYVNDLIESKQIINKVVWYEEKSGFFGPKKIEMSKIRYANISREDSSLILKYGYKHSEFDSYYKHIKVGYSDEKGFYINYDTNSDTDIYIKIDKDNIANEVKKAILINTRYYQYQPSSTEEHITWT